MTHHELKPTRATLHGAFSRDFAPCLTVDPGDTVSVETLDVTWGLEQHGAPGTPRAKFEPRDPVRDDGPALCGPIAVRGARPGQVLDVEIVSLEPMAWGWTCVGPGPFNGWLNEGVGLRGEAWHVERWTIDVDAGRATSESGPSCAIAPFLGTLGVAPGAAGVHSGWAPRNTGGNMDCSEVVAGSRLLLPIEVDGALVSLGDAHARQGDGECAGSAIECRMAAAVLRFRVRDDVCVRRPRVRRDDRWVTLGFGADLNAATAEALDEMLDVVQARHACSRETAMALASAVVDLRVTQAVNGIVGVHAVLADDALR